MTVEEIARVVHEANRAYCQTLGDHTQVSYDEAPDWQRNSASDGVRKILSGEISRPEQSHESWMAQKQAEGWVYGLTKDPEKKEHPCMVPFAELPENQRIKDHLFFAIVKALG